MAFAMILPIASEPMVTVPLGQWCVFHQKRDNSRDERIKVAPILPLLFALEVAAKGARQLNRPH
jgi:hypothetical protein